MQTELLNPPALGTPWLEQMSSESTLPDKTPIMKCPFTIGRKDSADLQIESSRVSREHAQIIEEGGQYRIVDLQSTNGTFVNGNRIEESPLCDGDMVAIANEEFTFYAGIAEGPDRMATQVIEHARPESGCKHDLPQELIHAVRKLQETLLQGSVAVSWDTIFLLSDGQPYGYEARSWDETDKGEFSEAERLVLAIDCRLTSRIRNLSRIVAVEEAVEVPGTGPLFLRYDTKDLGSEGMAESIAQLRSLMATDRRLILALPYTAAGNLPFAKELHQELRASDVGLAYYDFADLHEKALQQMDMVPDFLFLAKSVMRGLSNHIDRQRQIQAIVAGARKLGGEMIATGVNTRAVADLCRDLGCRFGQGTYRASANQ